MYLEPNIVKEYQNKGYIKLDNCFSKEEVAEWQKECDRLRGLDKIIHEDNIRTLYGKSIDEDMVFDRFDPVIDISPLFHALTAHPTIITALTCLLNDSSQLFKDKLIYKFPGACGYPMHQDWSQWLPYPAQDLVTVLVAIDEANIENGPVEFFPGLHNELIDKGYGKVIRGKFKDLKGELILTKPGDLIIFHSLVPHRSAHNYSHSTRRQLYLTYCAARHGDFYEEYREHVANLRRTERPTKRLFFR